MSTDVFSHSHVVKKMLSINQLIAARQPEHMLPADFYTRSDVFDADMDVFFRRQWLFVGVAADIPKVGDTLTVEIINSSVIIVRGDDGVIRAFHNICRHRASRLLEPGSTNVKKLVCPYHKWTYALTGELLFAKSMGENFDYENCGLRTVHLREVEGLLFICPANEAPEDIEEFARVMAPRLAPYDLGNAKVAQEESVVANGNWKLMVENNRECYHCATGHPELMRSYPAAALTALGYSEDELDKGKMKKVRSHNEQCKRAFADWESRGLSFEHYERTDRDTDTYFSSERYLIAGRGESVTPDTKVASQKLLGDIQSKDLGDLHLWTHTSWQHFLCDHAVTVFVAPLSADRTQVTTKWLVHKDAVEGIDYDLDNLTKVWQATNQQDCAFVQRQQPSLYDPAYVPGRYSPLMETNVNAFVSWYLGRLQAAGY